MSTSSTWASEKFRLAVGAVACVGAIYAVWFVLLLQLATWAELHADSHPYKGGEDALRYILPTIHAQPGEGRLLLIGSSNAGEALLYEHFDRTLPGLHATHGAFSMARLTEIGVLLDYIERVHGRAALPEAIVFGASTRVVSNVPWDEPSRAFHAIDTYSPYFKVETDPQTGSRLVPKSLRESLVARWNMLTKEAPRMRAAMALALLEVTGRLGPYLPFDDRREVRALTYSVAPSSRAAPFPEELRRSAAFIAKVGPFDAMARYMRFHFSPYLAHIHPPTSPDSVARLAASDMWWKDVRTWRPAQDELARRELQALEDFAKSRGIALYVVNLPEHPEVAAVYEGDLGEEYVAMLSGIFGDRFLDLSRLLPVEQFSDSEHSGYEGALEVSREVAKFIARSRSGGSGG